MPRAARTPPLPVKPELRVRGSRGKTRGPTGTRRCVGSGRSGEPTRSSDAEAPFSSQTRGPGSQLPPLAPGATPRISLSKTNHSERRLLHPDNRAPEPGLPPLHVRRPSTRPFRPLQNQPQLGLLPLRPRRAASAVGLQVQLTGPRMAAPLNGTYCLRPVPQVCFLPSGTSGFKQDKGQGGYTPCSGSHGLRGLRLLPSRRMNGQVISDAPGVPNQLIHQLCDLPRVRLLPQGQRLEDVLWRWAQEDEEEAVTFPPTSD